MNKDVVYIEPEEDITDIISKIEVAKSKIVALVPPKKAGVFKSIVNIKLIMKAGATNGKTVVLVTTDPSIIKLAAATKMPVTKDLNSAPAIPELEDVEMDNTEVVSVDDEADDVDEKSEKSEKEEKETERAEKTEDEKSEKVEADDAKEAEESEDDADEGEKDDAKDNEDEKPAKKEEKREKKPAEKGFFAKLANSNNPILKWIGTHKKADIGILVGLIVLIVVGVWAFGIAPAVTIDLKLETTRGNFSENVSFVDKLTDEKVEEGKFYIEEKKIESKSEVEFEATGKKNLGEKASGTLTVYYVFKSAGSVSVAAGAKFTYSNLSYIASDNTTITWGGKDSECKNKDDDNIGTKGCYIYKDLKVVATDSGASYNISATGSGWVTNAGVTVASGSAMAGGTDKTVTIVQQSDVDKAMGEINTQNESANKDKLLDSLEDDQFPIESSFKQTSSDPVSTPKVGEEVEEGKKAKLSVTTTSTIFVIDETKLKEFITEKAKLEEGYKIYEMDNPFVENFTKTDNGYVGKLKTSYRAGSSITENDVKDTVKGKGIGTAKSDLTSKFKGIKNINFSTSVPWVTSVPGNPEKITVIINVEE